MPQSLINTLSSPSIQYYIMSIYDTKPKATTTYKLFLELEDFFCYKDIVQMLKIQKSKTTFSKEFVKLKSKELDKISVKNFSNEMLQIISHFEETRIASTLAEAKKSYTSQRLGLDLSQYVHRVMMRHFNDGFDLIRNFNDTISIYHFNKDIEESKLTLAPCKFLNTRPTLHYEIVKDGNVYDLNTFYNIDGELFPASGFIKREFLILNDNQYLKLNYEDYVFDKEINLLLGKKKELNEKSFGIQIVRKIEQHKYSIEKGEFFMKEKVSITPSNKIQLSEINSGNFLMMTPQWDYDGYIVEGVHKEIENIHRDGKMIEVLRDKDWEEKFLDKIKLHHAQFSKQIQGYFFLSYDDAKKKNWFYNFYNFLLEENIEIVGLDLLQHFRYAAEKLETKVTNLSTIGNDVSMEMVLKVGIEKLKLRDVQKALLYDQTSLPLKDGTLALLDEEWIQQYGEVLRNGSISGTMITVSKFYFIANTNLTKPKEFAPIIEAKWWSRWQRWQNPEENIYSIPTSIQATLRPYQHKGYEWMRLLSEIGAGACLADDMGLGKTIQTISFIAHRFEINPNGKVFIVCPASLIYNWKNELEKFYPNAKVYIYKGGDRSIEEVKSEDHNIIITTYATMRNDIEALRNILWEVVVADESHSIRSVTAGMTKAIWTLRSVNKIALSGTPIVNNTFDLYSQLNFLLPAYLGSQESFRKEYSNPIDKDKNKKKISELQRITNPFILRRTKKQVATDLPDRTETTMWCEMGHEQKVGYDELKNNIRKSLFLGINENGLNKSKIDILAGISKLRQYCCSPTLVDEDFIKTTDSIKVDLLMEELINNSKSNKSLVFSNFIGMLTIVKERLDAAGIKYYYFDGSVDAKKRIEMVEEFQKEDNEVKLFLMTIKSGNAGITLTAADYVFIVDPWWNTAIEAQAIDRTHRIGQTKNVFAYKMVCKDSIEERIIEIQAGKQKLSDELISEEDGFVKSLSMTDVEYLFG
jgi:SNF2 family DNA or RNA helicase